MKHPSPETWMTWLYQESNPAEAQALETHLQECAECQQSVASWRSAQQALEEWPLPQTPPRPAPVSWIHSRYWQWAAAAVLVLGIGFLAGRYSSPSTATLNRLQQTLEPALEASVGAALRQELRQELTRQLETERVALLQQARQTSLQDLSLAQNAIAAGARASLEDWFPTLIDNLEQRRLEDHRALLAAFQNLQTRQSRDRHDLETLAVTTADELLEARGQIVRLAYDNPATSRNSPPLRPQPSRAQN